MATPDTCVSFYHPEHNPDGEPPRFQGRKELVVIPMGGPADLLPGATEAKLIGEREDWLKACAGYFSRKGGRCFRPLMVKDAKKDSREYRIWMLVPAVVGGRMTVQLHARFEVSDGFGASKVFRGQHAYVADPLRMSKSIRPVVDHVDRSPEFDRVEATAGIRDLGGKTRWGTVSRVFAHMHNYGLIRAVGENTYGRESSEYRILDADGDAEHAEGTKSKYVKTEHWDHFKAAWEAFVDARRPETDIYEPVESLSAAA